MNNKKSKCKPAEYVELPALKVKQGKNRVLYSFAVEGKDLQKFTTISRVARNSEEELEGYQRPEILSHIDEIKSYLESDNPMVPNALVIAFDVNVVKFKSASKKKGRSKAISEVGVLQIPIDDGEDGSIKAGWIVDGQQRTAAIRDAAIKSFPICVVGFEARNYQEQLEQFMLVNSTKALPQDLLVELVPMTAAKMPKALERKKVPAEIMGRLNRDEDSPLRNLVSVPTNASQLRCVKPNSIIKMVDKSLGTGILAGYWDDENGADVEGMLQELKKFWQAVKEVFPDAWGKPPAKSRLMHGVGIGAMGQFMDSYAENIRESTAVPLETYIEDLVMLKPECRWTGGFWDSVTGESWRWNEVQNGDQWVKRVWDECLAGKAKKLRVEKRKKLKSGRKSVGKKSKLKQKSLI